MAHPAHAAQNGSTADRRDMSAGRPLSAPQAGVPTADADYDAILATPTAPPRRRTFLAEHGRRTRGADTATVLAAIDPIRAALRGEAVPADAPGYLELGMMAMAGLIAAVENDIPALATGHETPDSARPRVQRLVGTLRDLGDCIQVMLDSWQTKPEPQTPAPAPSAPPALALVESAPPPEAGLNTSPADEFAADMAVMTALAKETFDTDATPTELADTDADTTTDVAQTTPQPTQTISREEALTALRSLSDAELIALFT